MFLKLALTNENFNIYIHVMVEIDVMHTNFT